MKKLFALFLILVVLLTLFGCANKEKDSQTTADELSTTPINTPDSYDPVLVDNITSDLDQMTW